MGPLNIRMARWLAAIVLGSTLILLGAIMLLTPGPGIPTIIGGLVVLSSEVVWARTLLHRLRAKLGMKTPAIKLESREEGDQAR